VQVTAQMDLLKKEVGTQQVTLARIAEHLLNPNGLQFSIDETPQVQLIQATLRELKAGLEQQQQAQEIQANALREGLMKIHNQSATITTVEEQIKDVKEKEWCMAVMLEKAEKVIQRLSLEFPDSREGGQPLAPPAEGSEMQAWVTAELKRLRWEVHEADSSLHKREIAELRASVEIPCSQALELHAQLAEELADVIRRCEEQRVDLTQAVETERLARINEASEIRAALNMLCDTVEIRARESLERGGNSSELSNDIQARLRSEITEERTQRLRESSESKANMDNVATGLVVKVDELSNMLSTAMRKWESSVEELARCHVSEDSQDSQAKLAAELGRLTVLVNAQPWVSEIVELAAETRRVASEIDARPWVAALDVRPWEASLETDRTEIRGVRQLVTKLQQDNGAMQARLDQLATLIEKVQAVSVRMELGDAEASSTEATAEDRGAPLSQVMALMRDTQEMLRFEFAARLTEVEMKMRVAPEPGKVAVQPRADSDELATRLEAIKGQLRAEIEKRIERSPATLPPPSIPTMS